MRKTSVSEEEIRAMDDYLKGYAFHERMKTMEERECVWFTRGEQASPGRNEISIGRVRQFEIRHFLMGMENSTEKLLLYYHYVKGDSVERCAELLGVARSTAFRMKKRALAVAVLHKKTIDGSCYL